MEKAQVIFEGLLGGTPDLEALESFGDSMMETLIDMDVLDPFVAIDGDTGSARVSFVLTASPGPASLALGSDILDRALGRLGLGLEGTPGVTASTEALAPA